ncbi:hypothetical protein ABIE27_001950 [Paenibacillus sp. 4624]
MYRQLQFDWPTWCSYICGYDEAGRPHYCYGPCLVPSASIMAQPPYAPPQFTGQMNTNGHLAPLNPGLGNVKPHK